VSNAHHFALHKPIGLGNFQNTNKWGFCKYVFT